MFEMGDENIFVDTKDGAEKVSTSFDKALIGCIGVVPEISEIRAFF